LGSGAWEKLVSPFFSYVGRLLIQTISAINTTYEDSIYLSAVREVPEIYSSKIAMLIILIVGMWILIVQVKPYYSKSLEAMPIVFKKIESLHWLFLGFLLVGFSFYNMSRINYAQNVRAYSIMSMDILRPYFDEQQYWLMKSQFLLVKTKNDFDLYRQMLIDGSKEADVELPEFVEI